jgi:hypothetical protein
MSPAGTKVVTGGDCHSSAVYPRALEVLKDINLFARSLISGSSSIKWPHSDALHILELYSQIEEKRAMREVSLMQLCIDDDADDDDDELVIDAEDCVELGYDKIARAIRVYG